MQRQIIIELNCKEIIELKLSYICHILQRQSQVAVGAGAETERVWRNRGGASRWATGRCRAGHSRQGRGGAGRVPGRSCGWPDDRAGGSILDAATRVGHGARAVAEAGPLTAGVHACVAVGGGRSWSARVSRARAWATPRWPGMEASRRVPR